MFDWVFGWIGIWDLCSQVLIFLIWAFVLRILMQLFISDWFLVLWALADWFDADALDAFCGCFGLVWLDGFLWTCLAGLGFGIVR